MRKQFRINMIKEGFTFQTADKIYTAILEYIKSRRHEEFTLANLGAFRINKVGKAVIHSFQVSGSLWYSLRKKTLPKVRLDVDHNLIAALSKEFSQEQSVLASKAFVDSFLKTMIEDNKVVLLKVVCIKRYPNTFESLSVAWSS